MVVIHTKGHESDLALRLDEAYQGISDLMKAQRWDAALKQAASLAESNFPRSYKSSFLHGNDPVFH